MPRIPEEIIEKLKHEVPVVLLAERAGVELKKMGEELMGRCPFPPHEDTTPSLSINPARNVWQCFGCGVGGTSIDWLMKDKRIDFRHAVDLLLREFFPEIAVEVLGESSAARQLRRTRAPELPCPFELSADDQTTLNEYAALCHALLKENATPQEYLTKRGLDSAELVSHFQLGYADRTLGLRIPVMTSRAGQEMRAKLQALGILRESGHEHLAGSLIIGIRDLDGNVTGLYGRKTRNDLRPGTPDHLYLLGHHRGVFNEEALKASAEVILCESLIDALTFWRFGFRNVTSAYGTNGFTDEILESMKAHGTERVVIAFDRDEAGDNGAASVSERLLSAGIDCARVLFPKGMDANEVALKMHPADKTLDLFLRSAEWMGNGHRPLRGHETEGPIAATEERNIIPVHQAASPAEATEEKSGETPLDALIAPSELENDRQDAREIQTATEEKIEEPAPRATRRASKPASGAALTSPTIRYAQEEAAPSAIEPSTERATPHEDASEPSLASSPACAPAKAAAVVAAVAAVTAPGLTKLAEDEAEFSFDDRRYRVRGLRKCGAYGALRINLKAEREGDFFEPPSPIAGWHMDNIDLCLHRQRAAFERQASHELGVKEELIRWDLGKIVKVLEIVQEQRIAESRESKVKVVKLSEKETEDAIAFWKSADLFGRIADDYTKCGLVGETINKIATYIGATSRLLDRPLAIIIQSSSAAGKSTLMDKTLAFLPKEMQEKYTAVSGKSLFYMDEGTVLSHKILAIVEEEGAERATYPLKILQSEGELIMASTGKDPATGKLVTKIYHVKGPVMIILTTTSVEIDPELENRCLRLTVDESREQTRAIHELQRTRMTYEGHQLQAEREQIQKVHQDAQRLLRRIRVHNPYAKLLTFVSDQTRTRRDHDKYLSLIETIALMHQFQRPIYRRQVRDVAEEYIDVTLADIELAGTLVGEIVGTHLSDLSPQTQSFLLRLEEMVTRLCADTGVDRCDLRFTRRQIRELTGWSDTAVRIHMSRLIELESVLVHRGARGQSFVYELLYNGEGKAGEPFVLGLLDVAKLRQESVEGAKPATTTSTSQGQRGDIAGPSHGLRTPFAGGVPGGKTAPQPAPQEALSDFMREIAENALLPPGAETTSYTPVVPTPANGNGHSRNGRNGNGNGRFVRINLVKRPALTLMRAAPAPA